MTTKIHSQSGLDRIVTGLAVSAFIGTADPGSHITTAGWRARCRNHCFERAQKLTATPEEAQALFDQAIAWAKEFTNDLKERNQ
jgi:hypothetical protein